MEIRDRPTIVHGMDFTSAPHPGKPITRACCWLEDGRLVVEAFNDLVSFEGFERVLRQSGPWIAGIDFPFGQSRKLVSNLAWPLSWAGYVDVIADLTREQFVEMLEDYKRHRPKGDKEHRRLTDEMAGSISPQKLYGVPVGKMFFEGAKRLLKAPVSIVPIRPTDDDRLVVEAYPALVARRWTGGTGYKSDTRSKQTEKQKVARERIVSGLFSQAFRAVYGFAMRLEQKQIDRLVNDPQGDRLDALLCAIQAAWAWTKRDDGYGVPGDVDVLEGWIVDPALVKT